MLGVSGVPVGRFACGWPAAVVVTVLATATVLLVWLSPALHVVFGPVEIEHTQVAPSHCELPGERLAGPPLPS